MSLRRATISLVELLLGCGGPSAVGFRDAAGRAIAALSAAITSIVVYAVNRHPLGAGSDIFKEARIVMPPFTNVNPPRAIVLELVVVAVLAATNHCFPGVVHGRLALAMRCVAVDDGFSLHATTSNHPAAGKTVGWNVFAGPAVAKAMPFDAATGCSFAGDRYDAQAPEPTPRKRLEASLAGGLSPHAAAACSHSAHKVPGDDRAFFPAFALAVPESFLVASAGKRNDRKPAERLASEVVNGHSPLGDIVLAHYANLHDGLLVVRAGSCYSNCPACSILADHAGGNA